MESLERIKQAKDCVVTQVYEQGRLVALRYRSSLGEGEERFVKPILVEENSKINADGIPQKRKHKEE